MKTTYAEISNQKTIDPFFFCGLQQLCITELETAKMFMVSTKILNAMETIFDECLLERVDMVDGGHGGSSSHVVHCWQM